MALLIQPPVFTRELAGPDEVGRFVLIGGRLAIVCVAPQDPQRTLMLATFDGNAFRATTYAGEIALTLGDQFVIEPAVLNGVSEARPGPQAGRALFADDSAHYLVVLFPSDWALVKLGSGEIVRRANGPMHAFSHWKLGVPAAQAGAPLWILQV
jgi:hypothetical protein